MSDPTIAMPPYEENTEFNESIDSNYSMIQIGNSEFFPSFVLYKLDEEAYYISHREFYQGRRDEFKEIVLNQFPTPVAMCFHRYEEGWEHNLERLHFLRDTWESLINVLHAIVIGEFRLRKINITGLGISIDDFFSDKLSTRLLTTERLLNFAIDGSLDVFCKDIIPVAVIQEMRDLNRIRNGFSHSSTLSDEQAARVISENIEQVLNLFISLEKLKNVHIIRYLGQNQKAYSIRHERFDGYAVNRRVKTTDFSPQRIMEAFQILNSNQILATNGDNIISLKPFVHFLRSGNTSKICLFKQKKSSDHGPVYEFEIVGEAEPIEIPRGDFIAEVNELRALLNLPLLAT